MYALYGLWLIGRLCLLQDCVVQIPLSTTSFIMISITKCENNNKKGNIQVSRMFFQFHLTFGQRQNAVGKMKLLIHQPDLNTFMYTTSGKFPMFVFALVVEIYTAYVIVRSRSFNILNIIYQEQHIFYRNSYVGNIALFNASFTPKLVN